MQELISVIHFCLCATVHLKLRVTLITDEDIQFSFVYTALGEAHTAHDCAALLIRHCPHGGA